MAKVQWVADYTVTVPELGGRTVNPDDVVEVPDERFEGFVPPKEHRAPNHPWAEIEAPAKKQSAKKAADKDRDN